MISVFFFDLFFMRIFSLVPPAQVHMMVHWDIQDLAKWKEAGEEFTTLTANEPENV